MRRCLALLGLLLLLSASADERLHHHAVGATDVPCALCQVEHAVDVPEPATVDLEPTPPLRVAVPAGSSRIASDRTRYRVAPKASPPLA